MTGPTSRIARAGLASPARAAIGTSLAGSALSVLSKAPQHLAHLFHRRFPTVAVTGMTGVGKTALADRLSRHSPAAGTADVGSAVMEHRTRRSRDRNGQRAVAREHLAPEGHRHVCGNDPGQHDPEHQERQCLDGD